MATTAAFDNYYPFASGAGATASQANWVNIGSSLREGGVLRKASYFRATVSAGTVTIQPGSVLIQGVYGETTANKALTIPTGAGTFGIIVAQANFSTNVVQLIYNDAVTAVVQNSGLWEYLLYRTAVGALIDCRAFMSPHDPIGQWVFSGY